jgi:nitroreductase
MMNGEETLKLICQRQSDRAYSDSPVEKEKLDRIIEAARMSPSACNAQPWKFIVVNEPGLRSEVAEAASSKVLGMNGFTQQAPILIVVVRERPNLVTGVGGKIKHKDYSLIDTGIAAENICLQAAAEGLGSCMLGWFDEARVKKLLSIPGRVRAELIITIGYPAKPYRQKRRRDLSEVVSYNKYL